MKKLICLVSAFILMACSDYDEANSVIPTSGDEIEIVQISGNAVSRVKTRGSSNRDDLAFSFASMEAYSKFKAKLLKMNETQRMEYVEKLGVKSLKKIEDLADEELEKIGNTALNEEDFRQKYENYKEKYSGILIPNSQDNTDLNLYAPDGKNIDAFIANSQKQFVINNRIVNADLKNQIDCISNRVYAAPLMQNNDYPINKGSWQPKSGKKVYFEAERAYQEIIFKAHARKKMWYGWKNDPHRVFYMCANLSNFVYYIAGVAGQRVEMSSPLPMYIFEKGVKNGFTLNFGRATSTTYGNVTGRVLLWTDMTVEYDEEGNMKKTQINSLGQKIEAPVALESKAHIVDIML